MRSRYINALEIACIVLLASVPLFVTFPFRVNIFLSWEGAYRMSQGELPFKDFGTPLGGMYWVIPAIFFKIFGTQMITLVKAQVFINIISGLAFRSILKSLNVQPGLRFASILLYCISYSFFNFWPWYNHTVIVYELIGLAFLLKGITGVPGKKTYLSFILAAFFTVCSFLTKQDAGAMAVLLSLIVLGYSCLRDKQWKSLIIYIGSFVLIFLLFIAPFLNKGFGYWFNHGQAPHTARISISEIIEEFLAGSQMIKFYFVIILVILLIRFKSLNQLWEQKMEMLFLLVTIGILGEAAVFQVTSYTPPDNNIFYHSFAVAYIFASLAAILRTNFNRPSMILACSLGILLWWSGIYWKYFQRIMDRVFPHEEVAVSKTGENVVNRKTFMIQPVDTTDIPLSDWVFSDLKSFKNIYMPASTAAGMNRLMNMELVKSNKNLRVLNMSELTPLAAEMPYKFDRGIEFPLWYHLGVGMFNKQAELFEQKIRNKDYDLVLFEYVPTLNNFYPFRVRDTLLMHYNKVDSFAAPRRGDTRGMIEIYTR